MWYPPGDEEYLSVTELVEAKIGVTYALCSPLYSQLREQVKNVHMVVSPLWRVLGNIHGFFLGGQSYQVGLAAAKKSTEPAGFGVRITACNITNYTCGKWRLVTIKVK